MQAEQMSDELGRKTSVIIGERPIDPVSETPSGPPAVGWDRLFTPRQWSFDEALGFNGGASRRSPQQVMAWSMVSLIVDLLVCFAVCCVLAILTVKSLGPVQFSGAQQLSLFFALGIVVVLNYMLLFRAFQGYTIGEWACAIRLGHQGDYSDGEYLVRVFIRCVLVLVTGIITIPFLNLICGRDFAGFVTGLKVTSLK